MVAVKDGPKESIQLLLEESADKELKEHVSDTFFLYIFLQDYYEPLTFQITILL